jgi:hypothetical protein
MESLLRALTSSAKKTERRTRQGLTWKEKLEKTPLRVKHSAQWGVESMLNEKGYGNEGDCISEYLPGVRHRYKKGYLSGVCVCELASWRVCMHAGLHA